MKRNIIYSRKASPDEIEFFYSDGTKEIRPAREVIEERDHKIAEQAIIFENAVKEAREQFRDNMEIEITYSPVEMGYGDDREVEFDDRDDLTCYNERDDNLTNSDPDLNKIALAYDNLNPNLPDLVNNYVTLHGLSLPLWELYAYEDSFRLGYRINAMEAFIVPEDAQSPTWSDNLIELRRILLVVNQNHETVDGFGIRSETTRWLYRARVNNGKIRSNHEVWDRANDPDYGDYSYLYVENHSLPIGIQDTFDIKMMSVAAFMNSNWAPMGVDDPLTREELWDLLLKLAADKAVPMDKEHTALRLEGSSLDYYIREYWLSNQDLPIPQKRWGGHERAAGEWEFPNDQNPRNSWWRTEADWTE